MEFTFGNTTTRNRRTLIPAATMFQWLLGFELVWVLFCLFSGRNVFSSASDRLEVAAPLVAFTVVNPAMHLALIAIALLLANRRMGWALVVAAANAAFIVGHMAVSLCVA